MNSATVIFAIAILFYSSVDARKCYECSCSYDWTTSTGSCSSTDFETNCALKEYTNRYCNILSFYDGDSETRYFQGVLFGPYQDSHFFEATESITFANNVWGSATFKSISYGCDWDGCNHPSLAAYLPQSFQMNINSSSLSSQLLNEDSSALICYSCIGCINGITATLCKQQSCDNNICYIDETHNYATTAQNNCTYQYISACQTLVDVSQPPSIQIRAVYYIDLPTDEQLQIVEVDIRCTKNLCNTVETVEFLKGQIQTSITINPGFQPNRPSSVTVITVQKLMIAFSLFLTVSLL